MKLPFIDIFKQFKKSLKIKKNNISFKKKLI